jgi:hypothetical protein
MATFFFILWIIALIIFSLVTAASVAEYMTARRSNRREQSRIFFETLRAERKLHHLASDAFASMMDVARSSERSREPSRSNEADDDAN